MYCSGGSCPAVFGDPPDPPFSALRCNIIPKSTSATRSTSTQPNHPTFFSFQKYSRKSNDLLIIFVLVLTLVSTSLAVLIHDVKIANHLTPNHRSVEQSFIPKYHYRIKKSITNSSHNLSEILDQYPVKLNFQIPFQRNLRLGKGKDLDLTLPSVKRITRHNGYGIYFHENKSKIKRGYNTPICFIPLQKQHLDSNDRDLELILVNLKSLNATWKTKLGICDILILVTPHIEKKLLLDVNRGYENRRLKDNTRSDSHHTLRHNQLKPVKLHPVRKNSVEKDTRIFVPGYRRCSDLYIYRWSSSLPRFKILSNSSRKTLFIDCRRLKCFLCKVEKKANRPNQSQDWNTHPGPKTLNELKLFSIQGEMADLNRSSTTHEERDFQSSAPNGKSILNTSFSEPGKIRWKRSSTADGGNSWNMFSTQNRKRNRNRFTASEDKSNLKLFSTENGTYKRKRSSLFYKEIDSAWSAVPEVKDDDENEVQWKLMIGRNRPSYLNKKTTEGSRKSVKSVLPNKNNVLSRHPLSSRRKELIKLSSLGNGSWNKVFPPSNSRHDTNTTLPLVVTTWKKLSTLDRENNWKSPSSAKTSSRSIGKRDTIISSELESVIDWKKTSRLRRDWRGRKPKRNLPIPIKFQSHENGEGEWKTSLTGEKSSEKTLPERLSKWRKKTNSRTNTGKKEAENAFVGSSAYENLNKGRSSRDSEGYSAAVESSKEIEDSRETHFPNTRKAARILKGDEQPTLSSRGLPDDLRLITRRHKRKIDLQTVSVIEGKVAALPCDLRSTNPNDKVQIILWIKEGLHTPIYSYDYREILGGQPKETKPDSNSTMSRRTSFRMDRSPAVLLIERAEVDDGGIYRCRVDFLFSPTINTRVNLTVVVPPSRVQISWISSNSTLIPVSGSEAGPFLEHSQPTLICANDDGWPPASVLWYEDDQLLDDSYTVNYDREMVENDLTFPPLTRDDLGRRLTCMASNINSTAPAATTVFLSMSLRIMGVKVLDIGTIWAGEQSKALCQIWGSRPPPNVLWWLGPLMLPPNEIKTIEGDTNVTISSLIFIPEAKDDGAMLICQATNEMLPDQAVQDSTILSVNYAPLVSIVLGRSLDPQKIKEGDDVYFGCSVVSKPPVFNVIWKHNGVELVSGSGIILSNMSLVVQGVTRAHGGNYTCHATNVRDTSASPPLHLDVKYTPVCASEQRQQHSVGKQENAEISCRVHANPRNVTFRWTFNNTAEAIDVPDGRFVVVGTESRVNYTPMNELDYGTLLCWANNTIGMQQYPCVFHIVAAGKPDPPHNCRVFDVTISSLQVNCLPGDDGGLIQTFLLQVNKVGSSSPIAEVTRSSPAFSVKNLRPATSYKIIIAAINDKGASRLTELKAYTLRVHDSLEETSAEPARDRDRGAGVPLAVLIGTIVAVVPIVIASVVLMWLRICRRVGNGGAQDESGTNGDSCSEAGGTTHSSNSRDLISTEIVVSDISLTEERNPDVVLHTADPGWSRQIADISTISPSSYVISDDGTIYPPVTIATTITNTNGGMHYTHVASQESFYTYPDSAGNSLAHSQLQSGVKTVSQVPYFTDSAQHHQKAYNTYIRQPPSSYQLNFQPGREFYTEGSNQLVDLNAQKVFPHLYQLSPGTESKSPQSSPQTSPHCSVHQRCPEEHHPQRGVPDSPISVSRTLPAMVRKGSKEGCRRSQETPKAMPLSIPSRRSLGDISQALRTTRRDAELMTSSLKRMRRPKGQVSFGTVETQVCQQVKTVSERLWKPKRESAV